MNNKQKYDYRMLVIIAESLLYKVKFNLKDYDKCKVLIDEALEIIDQNKTSIDKDVSNE